MKITNSWLKKVGACSEAVEYFKKVTLSDNHRLLRLLEIDGHLDWANWGMSRLLNCDNKVRYAICAAKLVIEIFEKKFPKDDRPRKAIDAAIKYLKTKSKKDRIAAYYAASAAFSATSAAAYYPPFAAASAASAAYYAVYVANAAAADAAASAASAAASAADAKKKMLRKIIEYGISLLKKQRRTK